MIDVQQSSELQFCKGRGSAKTVSEGFRQTLCVFSGCYASTMCCLRLVEPRFDFFSKERSLRLRPTLEFPRISRESLAGSEQDRQMEAQSTNTHAKISHCFSTPHYNYSTAHQSTASSRQHTRCTCDAWCSRLTMGGAFGILEYVARLSMSRQPTALTKVGRTGGRQAWRPLKLVTVSSKRSRSWSGLDRTTRLDKIQEAFKQAVVQQAQLVILVLHTQHGQDWAQRFPQTVSSSVQL